MDVNVRPVLGWIGQALVYGTPVLLALVIMRFFRQLARGDTRVAELRGLVSLVAASFCLGVGLSILSLPLDPLEALATVAMGLVILSLVMGIYGIRILLTQS